MGSLRIEEVNIETVNTCTRKCPYCKFGLDRKWEPRVMDREVFEKIISDLRAAGYDGLIGPFVNNEPLMDKRMTSFIGMITRELPSARSYLFTNGDLLDRERLHGLFEAGLHKIFISVHSSERSALFNEFVTTFGADRIALLSVHGYDKTVMFHNRGGSIGSGIVNQSLSNDAGCVLPFRQMVINPDGDVCLCCCDFYYDERFGNVRDASAVDIFLGSKRLGAIRKRLQEGTRKGLKLCERCSVPSAAPLLTL